MQLNKDNFKTKTIDYYLLSFLIPILIMLMAYKKMKLYPFGDFSWLSMDLWGQYFPMLKEQYYNGILPNFYSFNGALGHNLFSESAYYTNSIFNVFLKFFNSDDLIRALNFLILFKFGFASLSCCYYFKHRFKKINLITVAFSIAYALCSYNLAFLNQTMWFDAVIYFPLILVGLERLITNNKPVMYSLFLALTIFSSFYISFSICLFLCLYFIVFIVTSTEKFNFRQLKKPIKNFILFSLLAGGLSAFIILPIYKSIGLTVASSLQTSGELEFYNSLFEYITKLLPFTKTSLEFGIPNVYSGAFVFILLPLFIFNKLIDTKKKITYSLLVVILYFSMNLNVLDYIWHGFHFPNQLPGRWTFMFSFVLIVISYEAIANFKGISIKAIVFSLYHSLLMVSVCSILANGNDLTKDTIKKTAVLMVVYGAIIFVSLIKINNIRQIVAVLLGICIIGEMGINCVTVLSRDGRIAKMQSYQQRDSFMEEFVLKYQNDDNDFYRMEMINGYTFNPCKLYNYNGISYYSSTMTGDAYDFFKNIGQKIYARNVSTVYNPYLPVINSFLSIKYLIGSENKIELPGFEPIDMVGKNFVYQNKNHLPLAFMANDSLINWKSKDKDYFTMQNLLLNSAIGKKGDVFQQLNHEAFSTSNVKLTKDKSWEKQLYSRLSKSTPAEFAYNYISQKDQDLYLLSNFKKGEIKVTSEEKTQTFDAEEEQTFYIGFFKAGEKINITLTAKNVNVGPWGAKLYSFDQQQFSNSIAQLRQNSAEIIQQKNTKIKMKVNAQKAGLLYTSIADDGGWKVKCNGESLDIVRVNDYLIGCFLPQGENTIEFTYHVPGLFTGTAISLISLLILLAYFFINKNKVETIDTKQIKIINNDETYQDTLI